MNFSTNDDKIELIDSVYPSRIMKVMAFVKNSMDREELVILTCTEYYILKISHGMEHLIKYNVPVSEVIALFEGTARSLCSDLLELGIEHEIARQIASAFEESLAISFAQTRESILKGKESLSK